MKKVILSLSVLWCIIGIILWQVFFADTNYYLMSVFVLILSMIPFFVSFEHSKPTARELSLISSLIAIAVVSRAMFYLIPQVKPIAAVVVVSGVCLGAKKGYLIGAFSAFISNFIFGQGIWTPFQMVGLGLIGLLSGWIFSKIKINRVNLAIVGFILTFAVYGIIVDSCSVLMLSSDFTLSSVLTVYGAGVPFNLIFGATTGLFLFLFGEQFVSKLNRLVIKYGIGGECYGQ